jgi:outer membrane protein TolC
MRKYLISLIALLALLSIIVLPVTVSAEGSTIRLEDAIELALIHSPDIKAAETSVELADITLLNNKLAYESSYTSWAGSFFKNDAFQADSKAKREIWEASKDVLEDAKKALENNKEQVKYNIESQYLSILNMGNQIKLQEQSLDIQINTNNIELLKYDLGMSTNLEIQQLRDKTETMQNTLISMKNSLSTLYWQFNRSIGRKPSMTTKLIPVTFQPVSYEDNEEEALKNAYSESLALEQFSRMIEDKKQDIIDLNENSSEKAQKLRVEIEQTEQNLDNTSYGIELGLKTAREGMELAKKTLIEKQNSYNYQKNIFENKKMQFDLGIISEMVVSQSKIEINNAENNYEKATYDYYLATKKLSLAQKGLLIQ